MFANLRTELDRKNISLVTISKLIGCNTKTVQNKLQGKTEWRLSEILAISEELFPEFDLKYLFKRT